MSDTPASTPGPRRSQRDKKVIKPFVTATNGSTTRKRKRHETDTDNEDPLTTDAEEAQDREKEAAEDADDEEREYHAPKPGSVKRGKAKASPKSKGAPTLKKPRAAKGTATKSVKSTTRKGRKPKEGEDAYDADQVAKDTKIAADNPLFNAIMNPAAALQSTAEDFLESLEQSPGAAQAELINLFLRSCGCNDTVSADEALDYDGVVDSLDNITEALKKDNSPIYPLTSKLQVFKKFRKSLSEFIERLIASAADLDALYSSDLMPTLQTWVVAMSSSQIRSFRHTATVVALEVETALCDVASAAEKEAQVVGRQREGEKKRKGTAKANKARDKELQGKAQEIRERRTKLAEYLKEFVDGVFVHRYRDLDPNIRAECVKAIGLWFKKYPGHFLDGAYLRYVGWVLSDANTHVRLEAVKALSGVYEQADYIGSLNHFTERFKPRLLEMATSDTELSVRVAVIQVLGAIDGHSLLEEEEREKLCFLVYDEESRVRKAVSQFVRGVWEEAVEERLVGKRKANEIDNTRTGIKALATLLVKWSKALDSMIKDVEDSENGDATRDDEDSSSSTKRARRKGILVFIGADQRSRTALAVEALWEDVEPLRDWEELLDMLLLDHSAAGEGSDAGPAPRARANGHDQEVVVDNAWRLEEVEETVLLEVLVTTLRRAKAESMGSKKGEEENLANDITRALIKAFPRLFIKYQTDQARIAEVLIIPTLINLDLYLEMRMIGAYSSLWDDVIKQFVSHSSISVLSHAIAAIRYFMDATSLSNTNSTKILELEDELSSSLRDTVAGRDEIEIASFSEDEVLSLTALCTRLAVLGGTRDLSAWVDEDEGGKQSSAWDIISALVERGRMGYKEEETMVEQALHILTLHVLWKAKGLTADNDPTPDEIRYKERILAQRDSLVDKLTEYAVGTQSNTVDGVKRAAFKHLLNLHVLFSADQPPLPDGTPSPLTSLSLNLDDEAQYRCAGYVQAEIERYSEFLDDDAGRSDRASHADNNSDEGEANKEATTPRPKKPVKAQDDTTHDSRALLEQEYLFIDVITSFLRAIRVGTIHIRHGAILLAHYGRLGSSFDACSKMVVEILKEEGLTKKNGDVVVDVVTKALQEAYTLVLDGVVSDETEAVQLSKLLSSSFTLRGTQLSIIRRLEADFIVQIHTNLLNWIGKRIGVYENSKNKRLLKMAISFFRVLVPLLTGVPSGDALKVKAHMDQVLDQAKVEVSATSKIWEPQRSYEKRLNTVMSKDRSSKGRKSGKGVKSGTGLSSDDEESEVEKLVEQHEEEDTQRPRPKPTRATRFNPVVLPEEIDNDQEVPTTPKPRAPRAIYRANTTQQSPIDHQDGGSQPAGDAIADMEMHDAVTPKASLKRSRPIDDEEMDDLTNGMDSNVETTPAGDMHVRRKRIRH